MNDMNYVCIDVKIFENRKMKIMKSMPKGREYIVFWIQLLCLAGEANRDGWVSLTQSRDYTTAELSIITDTQEETIIEALDIFKDLNMIRRFGDRIYIRNWMRHQFDLKEEDAE